MADISPRREGWAGTAGALPGAPKKGASRAVCTGHPLIDGETARFPAFFYGFARFLLVCAYSSLISMGTQGTPNPVTSL